VTRREGDKLFHVGAIYTTYNSMIIVIKYRLLTSLPRHFNATVAKNFQGYEYAICKNIRRSAPQTGMNVLTSEAQPHRWIYWGNLSDPSNKVFNP
jgi:hypothetical protein